MRSLPDLRATTECFTSEIAIALISAGLKDYVKIGQLRTRNIDVRFLNIIIINIDYEYIGRDKKFLNVFNVVL